MKIELPLDGTPGARVRGASQVVFKSRYQLEILLLMAQEERFYHGQLSTSVPGTGGSFVTGVLTRYEDCGMIRALSADDGQSRKYYEKSDPQDPFWLFVRGWAESLVASPRRAVTQAVRP